MPLERLQIRHAQRSRRDRLVAATQLALVDERVGQRHDVGVHPILLREVDDGVRLGLGQAAEERDVEPALARGGVADEGRELVVVADEDELVREPQRTEAGWKGDLRGLVDDAVVELALAEERTTEVSASCILASTH